MRMISRLTVMTLIVCGSAQSSWSDEPAVIPVWPGKGPGETAEIGPEVIQPNKPGESPPVTRLTNVSQPTLTVFLPPPEKRNGTAVVICPGGGFNILAWNNDGVTCENSVQLFLALKKAAVASDLHIYSTGGHGFGLRVSEQVIATWPKRCEDWLRERELLKK